MRVAEEPPAAPPFVPGTIHGVRRWGLAWVEDEPRLLGHGNGQWEPGGRPTEARCLKGAYGMSAPIEMTHTLHTAPESTCQCGLYAHHPTLSRRHGLQRGWAAITGALPQGLIGIAEAWGSVELHATGFRAQYARPHALGVHRAYIGTEQGRVIAEAAAAYSVTVVIADNLGELVAHCRREGLGMSRAAVRALLSAGDEGELPDPEVEARLRHS